MVRTITAAELAENLTGILERVRQSGDSFVVEHAGEAMARLTPVDAELAVATLRQAASRLAGLHMPGDGFAEAIEAIQASQGEIGLSPWAS